MDLFDIFNAINNEDDIDFRKGNFGKNEYCSLVYSTKLDRNANNAITLHPGVLLHTDWDILGKVQCDYYQWINDFFAFHKEKHYIVFGNFESSVYSNSIIAYKQFRKDIKVDYWDYRDI